MGEIKASEKFIDNETRKKKEVRRLRRLFKEIPKNKIETVKSLIDNAAFMTIQLEDLQVQIGLEGVISEYQNGNNQFGTKKSPEVEVYNTMLKNHITIMKQLTDLLPKEQIKPKDDGFEDFINSRD